MNRRSSAMLLRQWPPVGFRTAAALAPAILLISLATSASAFAQAAPKPNTPSARDPLIFDSDENERSSDVEQTIKKHMRAGAEQLRKGNLDEAHAELLSAWELKRLPSIASSLATIEMRLGRYRDAAEHWDYLLKTLPADRVDDRKTAEAELTECRKHVSSVAVTVNTRGAAVYVDGRFIDVAPLEQDVWLEPGEHTIWASLGDRTSKKVTIAMQAEHSHQLALELEAPPGRGRIPAPVPVAASAPAPREHTAKSGVSTRIVVTIGGAVLTAAAGAIGIVSLVNAEDAGDEAARLRELVNTNGDQQVPPAYRCGPSAAWHPAECEPLDRKTDERHRAQNLAVGAFITAGALGAATLGAFLFWPEQKAPPLARVQVSPWHVKQGQGVVVNVTF